MPATQPVCNQPPPCSRQRVTQSILTSHGSKEEGNSGESIAAVNFRCASGRRESKKSLVGWVLKLDATSFRRKHDKSPREKERSSAAE